MRLRNFIECAQTLRSHCRRGDRRLQRKLIRFITQCLLFAAWICKHSVCITTAIKLSPLTHSLWSFFIQSLFKPYSFFLFHCITCLTPLSLLFFFLYWSFFIQSLFKFKLYSFFLSFPFYHTSHPFLSLSLSFSSFFIDTSSFNYF